MSKIAVISNLYPPFDRGGAEKIAQRQAEFLSKNNKVIVITSHPTEDYVEKQINENLKIIYFKVPNNFSYYEIAKHNFFARLLWRWKDMNNIKSANIIKDILKKEKVTKVFLHNLTGLGYQIPRMIEDLGLKQILTLHDVQLIHPSGQLEDLRKLKFLEKWYVVRTRKYFKNIDHIISPSKFLANYHFKYGFWQKDKMQITFNPVADNFYKEQIRNLSKPIKLLYVGQLNTAKGLQFLVKEILKNDKFILHIAGAGILEKYLDKIIKKNPNQIFYHGKVGAEELKKLYDQANFLVVPSLIQENLPTVILEAGARSLPAIASRVGGVPELVSENTGYTFPAENKEFFQNILNDIQKLDKDEYQKMQEKVYKKSQSWHENKYENILQNFLSL